MYEPSVKTLLSFERKKTLGGKKSCPAPPGTFQLIIANPNILPDTGKCPLQSPVKLFVLSAYPVFHLPALLFSSGNVLVLDQ